MQLRIDLHVHTQYSYDSTIAPHELAFYAKRRGIDGIAITDHDTLEGAIEIAANSGLLIIPGIEITSLDGHIVALNIKEPIAKGLPADETVDRIHDAGGTAIACHPVTFLKTSLGKKTSPKFDAVETLNASAIPFSYSSKQSQKLATRIAKPQVGGSDAHYGPEIGYAHTILEADLAIGEIIRAIERGSCRPAGRAIPWKLRFKRELLSLKRKL